MDRLVLTCVSQKYAVRTMTEEDIPEIYALCLTNPQYFAACGAEITEQDIRTDLSACPPGISANQKYYMGFYAQNRLIAVLDLLYRYPEEDDAFIGFFLVDGNKSGEGIGTRIIGELSAYLKSAGISSIQLAYEKTNPQARHFWEKNQFEAVREVEHERGDLIVGRRIL